MRRFEEKLGDLVFKDVTKRIIAFLVRYVEDFGKMKAGVITVKMFLSHQEIAHLSACSRQTVTTVLNDLKVKNLIDFSRKTLTIHNLSQFKALAN